MLFERIFLHDVHIASRSSSFPDADFGASSPDGDTVGAADDDPGRKEKETGISSLSLGQDVNNAKPDT
jgi:hypothetical protein